MDAELCSSGVDAGGSMLGSEAGSEETGVGLVAVHGQRAVLFYSGQKMTFGRGWMTKREADGKRKRIIGVFVPNGSSEGPYVVGPSEWTRMEASGRQSTAFAPL